MHLTVDLAEGRLNALREAYRTVNRANTTLQRYMMQLQQLRRRDNTTVVDSHHSTSIVNFVRGSEDANLSNAEDSSAMVLTIEVTIEAFEDAIVDAKKVGIDVTDAEMVANDWREEISVVAAIEKELRCAIGERSLGLLDAAIIKAQEMTLIDGILQFPTDTTDLYQLVLTAETTMRSVQVDLITTTLMQTMNDATIHDLTPLITALDVAQEYNAEALLPHSLLLPHALALPPRTVTRTERGHQTVDSMLLQVLF